MYRTSSPDIIALFVYSSFALHLSIVCMELYIVVAVSKSVLTQMSRDTALIDDPVLAHEVQMVS